VTDSSPEDDASLKEIASLIESEAASQQESMDACFGLAELAERAKYLQLALAQTW